MALDPEIKPRLNRIARRACKLLVGNDAHTRMEHVFARSQLADSLSRPADRTIACEHKLLVGCRLQSARTGIDLSGERFLRGRTQRLGFRTCGGRIRSKPETFKAADRMSL